MTTGIDKLKIKTGMTKAGLEKKYNSNYKSIKQMVDEGMLEIEKGLDSLHMERYQEAKIRLIKGYDILKALHNTTKKVKLTK